MSTGQSTGRLLAQHITLMIDSLNGFSRCMVWFMYVYCRVGRQVGYSTDKWGPRLRPQQQQRVSIKYWQRERASPREDINRKWKFGFLFYYFCTACSRVHWFFAIKRATSAHEEHQWLAIINMEWLRGWENGRSIRGGRSSSDNHLTR